MRLQQRSAVVTGGASGIGRAIARLFAAEGARVLVADLRETPVEGGEPTHELIRAAGGIAEHLSVDVSRWADVDAAVSLVVSRWGGLDVMVNNVAIDVGTDLLATSEADWDRAIAVNAKGVFFGCKRAVQQMLTQRLRGDARGRIVNISSQHGMVAHPRDVAYGTGKAAVVYLTRQVAASYAKDGIVCNAVAPGRILTGRPEERDDPTRPYSLARTPMPRLGTADDVAYAALFLASDECRFTTGVNLMVDGGWMAA